MSIIDDLLSAEGVTGNTGSRVMGILVTINIDRTTTPIVVGEYDTLLAKMMGLKKPSLPNMSTADEQLKSVYRDEQPLFWTLSSEDRNKFYDMLDIPRNSYSKLVGATLLQIEPGTPIRLFYQPVS